MGWISQCSQRKWSSPTRPGRHRVSCVQHYHSHPAQDGTSHVASPRRAKLDSAMSAEKQMVQITGDLCVYFACKSEREHGRVLRALSEFRPLLENCFEKLIDATPVDQAEQAVEQSDSCPTTKTRAKPKNRTVLGTRNVNGSEPPQMKMEGLGAAVAARAASRRAALAALP